MKVISVADAAPQLGQLILDAIKGETIMVTNGDDTVELLPRPDPHFLIGHDELEAELLKGLQGQPRPFSAKRLEEACHRAVEDRKKS